MGGLMKTIRVLESQLRDREEDVEVLENQLAGAEAELASLRAGQASRARVSDAELEEAMALAEEWRSRAHDTESRMASLMAALEDSHIREADLRSRLRRAQQHHH